VQHRVWVVLKMGFAVWHPEESTKPCRPGLSLVAHVKVSWDQVGAASLGPSLLPTASGSRPAPCPELRAPAHRGSGSTRHPLHHLAGLHHSGPATRAKGAVTSRACQT